jgi:hypothetical protein
MGHYYQQNFVITNIPYNLNFPAKPIRSFQKEIILYLNNRSVFIMSMTEMSTWCPIQGILKGDVSLYHWPPVWLVWNQLYDYWQFLFLFAKQTNPNQSNRMSMVQWYFPLVFPALSLRTLPPLWRHQMNLKAIGVNAPAMHFLPLGTKEFLLIKGELDLMLFHCKWYSAELKHRD